MINAPPDFAITKLGMSCSHPRKRDKSLRTYGKRSAPARDGNDERPAKRQLLTVDSPSPDVESPSTAPNRPTLRVKSFVEPQNAQPTVVHPNSSTDVDVPSHSSILNYFKRIAPGTVKDSQSPPKDEVSLDHLACSSPRSDIVIARRKPRLLRLRAASSPLSDEPAESNKRRAYAEKNRDSETPLEDYFSDTPKQHDFQARDGEQIPIDQADDCTVARRPSATSLKAKSRRVQTTLNLSAQAAFAECKVCDTVWNPLYPDDVKYHAKRHATVTRARDKKQDNL